MQKETKQLNKWKAISCSCKIYDYEDDTLLKVIYGFIIILIKIPMASFCRNGKDNDKIHIGSQGNPNSPNNSEKRKNKVGRLTIPNFKSFKNKKSLVIKTGTGVRMYR